MSTVSSVNNQLLDEAKSVLESVGFDYLDIGYWSLSGEMTSKDVLLRLEAPSPVVPYILLSLCEEESGVIEQCFSTVIRPSGTKAYRESVVSQMAAACVNLARMRKLQEIHEQEISSK